MPRGFEGDRLPATRTATGLGRIGTQQKLDSARNAKFGLIRPLFLWGGTQQDIATTIKNHGVPGSNPGPATPTVSAKSGKRKSLGVEHTLLDSSLALTQYGFSASKVVPAASSSRNVSNTSSPN